MDLTDFLFAAFVIGGSLLIWFYIKGRVTKQKALNQIWAEFARLNGLEEQDGDSRDHEAIVSFRGKNQGMPFVLECIATEGTPVQVGKLELSRGENTRIFTRMHMKLPGLPRGLRVYRETPWSKLGKAVGMQDIMTGDPEFDRSFVVKGKDPQAIVDYLTPSRRITLLSQPSGMKGLELQEEGLILLQPGQVASMEELGRLFSQLGSLATTLV
jgi:hypothetical protein